MTDDRDPSGLLGDRRLRYAEGVVRLVVACVLVALVVWSVCQEPGNDADWSMDAVRLGLFLTATLVLVRAPGVRWPPTGGK